MLKTWYYHADTVGLIYARQHSLPTNNKKSMTKTTLQRQTFGKVRPLAHFVTQTFVNSRVSLPYMP